MNKVYNIGRKIFGRPQNWYRGGMELVPGPTANEIISSAVLSGEPFMVSRLGSVEIKPILFFNVLQSMPRLKRDLLYFLGDCDDCSDKQAYQSYMIKILCNNAGFFPSDIHQMERFSKLMPKFIRNIDLCGCWLNEKLLRDFFSPNMIACELGCLEPYDYDKPWTKALEGKRILVIHPFSKTIERQYSRRELLWENNDILPEFDLLTIKAVQTIAGEKSDHKTWFEALSYMQREIEKVNFDVALIGCGAYGLPLAAFVKSLGKVAIHLGGPLQVLFGIKGKRWDSLPSVARYYNNNWVRPLSEERPLKIELVEDGCYW